MPALDARVGNPSRGPARDVVAAVERLVDLVGGGALSDAWVLVTEASSLGPTPVGGVAVGPVVDATAAVRRLSRARSATG